MMHPENDDFDMTRTACLDMAEEFFILICQLSTELPSVVPHSGSE